MIVIIVALFLASVILTVLAGIDPQIALLENLFASLEIFYNLIPYSATTNPLILATNFIHTIVFALLAFTLASWFFDFISNISIRERVALSVAKKLQRHVIVVPFNQFAGDVIKELKRSGIKTVTIAESRKELVHIYRLNELGIPGNIKEMEVFEAAGIKRARYIVACSDDDMQNALIAITAKAANPNIEIIARVSDENDIPKLDIAGAKRMIMPEITAGQMIGEELAKRSL